ncbi:MAG: (Fe-S)-binding protein [Verrucomicrobia bacterium]|nr:MAG: (Fe-S)-binding protein [Verrucomicrobiota bacterium]
MPLPTKDILGILADNLNQRKSVLPMSAAATTRWAKGLDLPKGGKTILYTGHMYQLIPIIDAMATQMSKLEDSPITKYFGLGRNVNKLVNMTAFMGMMASKADQKDYDRMLRNIAGLLKKAGIDFGYLYGEELYSGALVYDEGIDGSFAKHAQRVCDLFKKHGVERVITVDPHTTHTLRTAYPQFVEGFDVEVKSYLEVLAESGMEPAAQLDDELALHDSCVYARNENVVEQPRELLVKAGVRLNEPSLCGKNTHCCGGPLESLFPSESHRIAGNRAEQLKETKSNVATMCPICLVSLRKAAKGAVQINDISDTLARAYGV